MFIQHPLAIQLLFAREVKYLCVHHQLYRKKIINAFIHTHSLQRSCEALLALDKGGMAQDSTRTKERTVLLSEVKK